MANPLPGTPNRQQQENLKLLKVYTGYRVLLSFVLLLTFVLAADKPLVGGLKPVLFIYTVSLYSLINMINFAIVIPKRATLSKQFLFANFFIDVVAILFLADSTGGIISGLGIFLVITICAASILLTGQLATLIAAMASLAVIADTLRLMSQHHLDTASLLPSGLMGFSLFAISFVIQNLAQRIRRAQLHAEQQDAAVSQLEQFNQLIVQRMRTGILVADANGEIKMQNDAATELLQQDQVDYLSGDLLMRFKQWRQRPQFQTPTFRISTTGPELQASFSKLTATEDSDTLIFIEDNRRLSQRAQQIKLASLGRLTASIAHEIRNPLGAISHAAQLLSESTSMDKADTRLADIIHNHCDRMNNIIENIMQLSRRHAPKPVKTELRTWLSQFITEYKASTNSKAAIELIEATAPLYATIDISQLQQVLTNIFDNGLRYSQQKTGTALLQINTYTSAPSGLTILDIIDEGDGVDEEMEEKLFEPFFTTESTGTGLGLYLSRELCEANQARLDYTRTLEGKSCFRISFSHPDRLLEHEAINENHHE
jgi:two-component system sensor histidine kinase PilS (NtrC family)